MAWDDKPNDWTPAPVGRGDPVPEPKPEPKPAPEERCGCGHPMSRCAPENCSHPFAAAALWGD